MGTEQYNERPYVVMSRLLVNRLGDNVVGVPLSKQTRKASAHRILIPSAEIIKAVGGTFNFLDCVALTDMLRVLARCRTPGPIPNRESDKDRHALSAAWDCFPVRYPIIVLKIA